jgi:hypothetical protein
MQRLDHQPHLCQGDHQLNAFSFNQYIIIINNKIRKKKRNYKYVNSNIFQTSKIPQHQTFQNPKT